MPSTVAEEDLNGLVVDGLLAPGSWRLPEDGEIEPAARLEERFLITTHLERGFSLPPHPFF